MAIDNFGLFREAVAKHIAEMAKTGSLFHADVEKDDIWNVYLSSFPEGTNPVYKEKTEHDCNCCKSFIRAVGGLVSIKNGVLTSVWEIDAPEFYQDVADAAKEARKKKARDEKILELLAKKEHEDLEKMSKEELEALLSK